MVKKEKIEWSRPNITKKLFDKVDKYSKKTNGIAANRLIEKWLQDYVEKNNL